MLLKMFTRLLPTSAIAFIKFFGDIIDCNRLYVCTCTGNANVILYYMVKRRVNNPKILYVSIAFNRKIVKSLLASNRHEVSIVLNTSEEQGFPT